MAPSKKTQQEDRLAERLLPEDSATDFDAYRDLMARLGAKDLPDEFQSFMKYQLLVLGKARDHSEHALEVS